MKINKEIIKRIPLHTFRSELQKKSHFDHFHFSWLEFCFYVQYSKTKSV